jgi:4-amino-4-deoxy-L-arabinose transferase-like glycosyltransferase
MWVPAFLLVPWAIPAWWRRLRRHDPRYLLLLGWWLLIVLFFSIPHGKRDVYILPALPMFCLALAPLLPGLLRRRDVQWVLGGFAVLLTVALLGIGVAMLGGEPSFERKLILERGIDTSVTAALGWVGIALGSWGVVSLVFSGARRFHLAVVSLLAMAWVAYGLVGYPLFNDSSSARGLMYQVGQRIGPDAELGLVGWKEQNLLMSDRPVRTFGFKRRWYLQLQDGRAWQAQAPERRWLLVQQAALLACVDRAQAERVGVANRRGWWLVPARAFAGPCQPSAVDLARIRREQGKEEGED